MYAERVDQVVAMNDKIFVKMEYKERILDLTKEGSAKSNNRNHLEDNITITALSIGDTVAKQCNVQVGDKLILNGVIDMVIDIKSNQNQEQRLKEYYKALSNTEFNVLISKPETSKVDVVVYGFTSAYMIAAIVKD